MDYQKEKPSKGFLTWSKSILELFSPFSVIPAIATEILIDRVIKSLGDRQLFTKEQDDNIQLRAQEASNHLSEAGRILGQLQGELNTKNQELQSLLSTINDRKDEASHYEQLANLNKKTADAFTKEIEKRMREQIRIELERGKTKRKIISAIVWTITLILGGVVGVLFQKLWDSNPLFK